MRGISLLRGDTPGSDQRTFLIVWGGQLVSVVGSGLTSFGLGIWVLQETGSVTAFALTTLFITLPAILLAPAAGAYVDRTDRRLVMLGADLVAGLGTAGIAVVWWWGMLEVWHIYAAAALTSAARAFQEPAYMASIPMLVRAERLSRSNGMVMLAEAIGTLISPALAGLLLVTVGVGGIIAIDVSTFLIAVVTLAAVRFPTAGGGTEALEGAGLLAQAREGWDVLRSMRGMVSLLVLFAAVNFVLSLVTVLYVPLLLAFTSEQVLGLVVSVAGVGMLIGSIATSAWEGPSSKLHGISASLAGVGVGVFIAGLAPSTVLVGVAAFVVMGSVPLANTSAQTLFQRKIPPDLQGRAFSVRRVFSQSATPLSYVIAGPLIDRVFDPLLADGGPLASSVGQFIGTGDGRGIALLFLIIGVVMVGLAAFATAYEPIAGLEARHPDVGGAGFDTGRRP